MEHIIRFEPGYDCIRFECASDSKDCKPNSGGSHGRHGLQIRFVVKGEEGAVQFLLYTSWLPQQMLESSIGSLAIFDWGSGSPIPADLGYHSKTPHYENQKPITDECEFFDGPCYYDGSGLNAAHAMYALVNGGDEALWKFLEDYYRTVFEDADFPQAAEYGKGKRECV